MRSICDIHAQFRRTYLENKDRQCMCEIHHRLHCAILKQLLMQSVLWLPSCSVQTSSLIIVFCLVHHFVHDYRMQACACLGFYTVCIIHSLFKTFMKHSVERTSCLGDECRTYNENTNGMCAERHKHLHMLYKFTCLNWKAQTLWVSPWLILLLSQDSFSLKK